MARYISQQLICFVAFCGVFSYSLALHSYSSLSDMMVLRSEEKQCIFTSKVFRNFAINTAGYETNFGDKCHATLRMEYVCCVCVCVLDLGWGCFSTAKTCEPSHFTHCHNSLANACTLNALEMSFLCTVLGGAQTRLDGNEEIPSKWRTDPNIVAISMVFGHNNK